VLTGGSVAEGRTVGASVDLGSNSVHLLVAAVAGHELEPLVDESVFLGLGTAIAKRGYLGASARRELADALSTYAQTARGLDASHISFIGTEPIRRAADAASIVAEVSMATSVPLHVVSHEEEAFLTLIGVTEGLPVTNELLVVDIGGGSSEFCMVDSRGQARATGLPVGSSRLTDALVQSDPATQTEIDALRSAATAAAGDAPPGSPSEIVAVGGTASNLIKVLHLAGDDRRLTRERIDEAIRVVAGERSEAAAARHIINPRRARLLPAGGAILEAILDRYGLEAITVSESGVREGTVRVVEHAGRDWRDRLTELARGWRA
jgi:exopolyphosphatase/guanosine-5'-triphosphate,3'-diphosphate pyrophosphatase